MSTVTETDQRRSFTVMGSASFIVVNGGPSDLVERAEARLRQLEGLWSRFQPDSDITRINQANGRPIRVHEDTVAIVLRALEAWKQTRGAFDITVLPALVHHGYTHSAFQADAAPRVASQIIAVCNDIVVDLDACSIAVPTGAAIDLGGIGKGFAADIVAEDLLEWGAEGALVNVGGDIAVRGAPAGGQRNWYLGVQNPLDTNSHVVRFHLPSGGVATSGTTIKRWAAESGEIKHHLIDPTTAFPARTNLLTLTVIAGDAATAEVFATAAMMHDGPAAMAKLEALGLAAIAVGCDGTRFQTANLGLFTS